jgi:hypothetical protein
VASERQIAANRRNAQNSTGPRSAAGKRRASRNSYRHGLTSATTSSAKWAKCVERLACEIAGDTSDVIILEYARTAGEAEFDLAQIHRVKVAIIERIMAFGEANRPRTSQSLGQVKRFFSGLDRGELVLPNPVDAAPAMPETEPERSAEAVRRALPELVKLDRYERRAAIRRERALRIMRGHSDQPSTNN